MGRQQQRRQQQRRQERQRRTRPEQTRPGQPTGATRGRPPQRRSGGGTRNLIIAAAAIVAVAVVVGILVLANRPSNSATPASGTSTPAASTPVAQSLAPTVDGIQCGQMEALAYHIHQYLELFDHGKPLNVPSEIGIPGGESNATCYYWIHVHAATPNIIHVESPIQKTFTLGNFFDIWKSTKSTAQPPGDAFVLALQRAAKAGQVTAFVQGKRWHGSYRNIPLTEHEVIAVEIGTPVVPPRPYTNWSGL
ncbi:MAG TPA: hypothetical protein VKX16_12190 [Chloroflexota bacterium]|nr:hypothetical protein [Chloroflexota bacterium]